MMTPALEALTRKLAANPRWKLPGMLAVDVRNGVSIRLHADREGAVFRYRDGSLHVDYTVPESAERLPPGHDWIPDLSDPLTAAGLVVIAREVSGCPEAVACRVDRPWERRAPAWVVWRYPEAYAAWREHGDAADVLSGVDGLTFKEYVTELEAWASVILGGGE